MILYCVLRYKEENEARELGLLYTVPSGGINMSQSAGSQGPAGQESPPRSMSDRSGSGGGGKSANKEESDSSRNNGYENKRLLNYPNNREAGQLPSGAALPPICPTGNNDESSHYHSYLNRKSDAMMDAGDRPQSLSPGANGTSKLSNNSLSPKSQQLMDSDSDDSDHNSHPTGT